MTETTTPTPEEMREMADRLARTVNHMNPTPVLIENAIAMLRSAASALDAKGETTREKHTKHLHDLLASALGLIDPETYPELVDDINAVLTPCDVSGHCPTIAAPPLAPSSEGGWQPIDQTKFGYPEGNCLAACLASFFKLRLEDLPDLNDVERSGGDWWKALCDICVPRGFRITHALASFYPCPPKGLHIAGGKSPRGDFDHVVLVEDGVVVHDPHPSRAGLRTHEDYYLMIPMDESPRSVAQSVQEYAVFINNEQTEKLNASAPREPQPSSEASAPQTEETEHDGRLLFVRDGERKPMPLSDVDARGYRHMLHVCCDCGAVHDIAFKDDHIVADRAITSEADALRLKIKSADPSSFPLLEPREPHAALVKEIDAYFCNGGLFNPELANHDAVSDLLRRCKAAILGGQG